MFKILSIIAAFSLLNYGQCLFNQNLKKIDNSGYKELGAKKKNSYDLGLEYAVQGRFQEAKREFEKALKKEPFISRAENSLKILKDVNTQRIKRETALHIFEGTYYFNRTRYDRAISNYTKAIEINPMFEDAYVLRGKAYRHNNQDNRAMTDFAKAIDINPEHIDAFLQRGGVYFDKKQYGRALSDYSKTIEINPMFARGYINRGVTNLALKNRVNACADLKMACKLGNCDNYNILKQKGTCQ